MEKIKNKKVLFSKDRIICNEKGVSFGQLNILVQTYIGTIRHLKNIPSLNFNQDKFNSSIHFKLFNLKLSVIELFEVRNMSAEKQGLTTFTKLFYDPKNATTFSPSQVSGDLTRKNKLNDR